MDKSQLENGVTWLIDKPLGWTSFDVVRKIRNATRIKKVGHAGTLDPLATGLLIVCAGKNTKLIDTYQAQEKTYTGTFLLGETTPCYDREQPIDAQYPVSHIDENFLEITRKKFLGEIWQTPPAHSAIKLNGKRAFDLARAGEEVLLKPRLMEIKQFELNTSAFPLISFIVVCTKGTYIRSLINDFGKQCNSGAVLESLRRTAIGTHQVSDAFTIDALVSNLNQIHSEK